MTTTQENPSLMQGVRRYGAGAGGFFRWWKQALLSWLPLRWRVLFGLASNRLLFSQVGDQLRLQVQDAEGLHEIAWLPLPLAPAELDAVLGNRTGKLPRWLLLPAASALQRRLLLPAAAAERLRDVVGFEVDRQTPFTADSVRFDARVLERRADGQLDTELVAVPRARFDAALAGLGGLAGSLAGVDASDASGRPLGVNLLPTEIRRDSHDAMRGWNWALGAIALLGIATAFWQVLDNRRDAAEAFAKQVEIRAAQARAVAAERQQLVDIVEGAAFLDRARAARPTTVEILDELSRRLPDNTYLEKVGIEGDRLLLIGLSPEASALVGRMEGSRLWRAPALSGALQPDPRTRLDRFSLTADLATAPKPAASTGAANGARQP
ncbi:PilN domain-containing protein [Pseudoxanthomonas sacheonensis]|uniref:General secretion pathway protein L n=1 Tax=Pseudoxanthomonas sacheonensis TaxID=443615 RepID=A0ABU1RWL6_9GAMM|nr:PilN domain-containing protein [Pseudoxanthomonas sacheonensis]MDR6843167.1 general secretion pathway protein L [Pseudoxanthomonas sacheonensis]